MNWSLHQRTSPVQKVVVPTATHLFSPPPGSSQIPASLTAGWRVYFSLEPWRMRSALAAACSGQSDRPSMRFPYL